jgi:hypothetical protein
MTLTGEDFKFLRALARGLLALAMGAAVTLALSLVYYQFYLSETGPAADSLTIAGKEMVTVLGSTRIEDDALLVTGLETEAEEEKALVSAHLEFDARSYPYLHYKFDGLQSGMRLQLFWGTAEDPELTFAASMPMNPGASSTFNLGAQPQWRGTITDIAVFITGDLRAQPVRIPGLTLAPPGWRAFVASAWSGWTAFRGWTGLSVNYLWGTPTPEYVSPVAVIAIWAGLALAILFLMDRAKPAGNLISYGVAILVPWMVLDQFWQRELSAQLQDTKYLFTGKSTYEKHLVDVDQDIYRYANRLKGHVLPSSPARIFILHDSYAHNLDRLKTQYYLLPHNIFNFNTWLPHQQPQSGDYILALGVVPHLSFDTTKQRLRWQTAKLEVTVVDQDRHGILYRVSPGTDLPLSPDDRQEVPNG